MRARVAAKASIARRTAWPSALNKPAGDFSAAPKTRNVITAHQSAWNFANISILAPAERGERAADSRRAPMLPPEAQVAAADSPLEREADHAAKQVMCMTPSALRARTAERQLGREPAGARAPVVEAAPMTSSLAAPRSVHEVLRSPGQPLDAATRAFFEPRFGYDFSHVRVSTENNAAKSAERLHARSYTAASQIVFAPNEYQPGTSDGRQLLAHELAHVVQQGKSRQISDASPTQIPGIPRALTPAPQAVQRKPQTNWAGTFTDDVYRPISESKLKPPRYGAHIEISFLPNESVDAKNIAFIQTAQMLITDNPGDVPTIHSPYYVQTDKDESVFRNRLLTGDEDKLGTHIDQPTKERTPLYSMTGASEADIKSKGKSASPLAASVPTKFSGYGHHTKGEKPKAATMLDQPGLEASQGASASAKFETTALAVEGTQQGTYYGTITWGFTKDFGETEAKLLPFQLAQSSAPSATFFEAAKAFGASKTTADEQSLSLPAAESRFVNADTSLWSSPGKDRVARLSVNTPVETMSDSAQKGWVKVMVTDGDHKGFMGWLKASEVSTAQKIIPKKRR